MQLVRWRVYIFITLAKNLSENVFFQNEDHNSLNIMANQLTFMFGEKLPLRFHILREAICGSNHTSCTIVRRTEIGTQDIMSSW
jgi:hypothetical protein